MKRLMILLIKFYKGALSPYIPRSCRFTPTCSDYAIEAINKYGAIKGGARAAWRILRCNPFCRGGYDPLP